MEELHALFLEHPTICTDTRKITENCLFFALKGPNFNGNAFAQQALDKGKLFTNLAKRHPALKHGIPGKLFKVVEAILSHLECHVRLKQDNVSGFM